MRVLRWIGNAVGVAGLVVLCIADAISTNRRNKAGLNHVID